MATTAPMFHELPAEFTQQHIQSQEFISNRNRNRASVVVVLRQALFPNDPVYCASLEAFQVDDQAILMLTKLLRERCSPYDHEALFDLIEKSLRPLVTWKDELETPF